MSLHGNFQVKYSKFNYTVNPMSFIRFRVTCSKNLSAEIQQRGSLSPHHCAAVEEGCVSRIEHQVARESD